MQEQGRDSCVVDKTREKEEVSSLLTVLEEGTHRCQGPLTSRWKVLAWIWMHVLIFTSSALGSVTGACQGLGVGVDRTSVTHNKGWKPILGGKATGTRCQSVSVLCPNTCQLGILHVIGAMGGDQPRAKTLP